MLGHIVQKKNVTTTAAIADIDIGGKKCFPEKDLLHVNLRGLHFPVAVFNLQP